MDGILLIDKDIKWTSRDVCNKLQNLYNTRSVGHTGTLDPFATGLLIVTVNKGNKIAQFMDGFKKTYVATLKLGIKTNTGDLSGEIIQEENVPLLTYEYVEEILNSFLGEQEQLPPMTSAKHVNGKKLYQYFYEGEEVKRTPNKINIYDIKLLSFDNNIITFEATVSTGTYIRVLGEDIASRLNSIGHLTSLRRTSIGHFNVKDAKKIEEVFIDKTLTPINKALSFMEKIVVEDDKIKSVKDGVKITNSSIKDDIILLVDKNDTALAVYIRKENDTFICKRGLW